MSLSAIVQAMAQSGCTAEQIAHVVAQHEAAREARDAERREKDRERQRRSRSRHAVSRNVTVTPCDSTDMGSPEVSPKEIPPTPPKEITPSYPLPTTDAASARATRIPEGFTPNEAGMELADAKLGVARTENELAKFRDYWAAKSGKDATKRDWDATWRNWVRTASERRPTGPPPRPPDKPPSTRLNLLRAALPDIFDAKPDDPTIIEFPPARYAPGG